MLDSSCNSSQDNKMLWKIRQSKRTVAEDYFEAVIAKILDIPWNHMENKGQKI